VSLMMRSALLYVVAALAPLVWSAGVLPSMRGSSRKLVHLAVSLVVSKLAIAIALVVAVKLIAHPSGDPASTSVINDGAAAVGTLMSGFICFMIAAVTPMVLYRLMPTIEGAAIGSGVASGWMRGATTAAHTGLMVKSLGASAGASAATRAVRGQAATATAAPTTAKGAGPVPSFTRPPTKTGPEPPASQGGTHANRPTPTSTPAPTADEPVAAPQAES
jgi:hypothetical protein